LLVKDRYGESVLNWVSSYSYDAGDENDTNIRSEDHIRHVDNLILTELIRWRRMGLLLKEDIQKYGFVKSMVSFNNMPGRRLRFFIEWDPSSLLKTTTNIVGSTPFHYAVLHAPIETSISLFDYLIRYYPFKIGICALFQQGIRYVHICKSPYENLCFRFNRGCEMLTFVEETLARYSNATPINTQEALLLAATTKKIDLSCVYFLLRRQPDFVLWLLSSSRSISNSNDGVPS